MRLRPRIRVKAPKPALPESYLKAKRALRHCARDFSPASYFAAIEAMQAIESIDPCDTIESIPNRISAYSAIAGDNELSRLAMTISAKHREWKQTASG